MIIGNCGIHHCIRFRLHVLYHIDTFFISRHKFPFYLCGEMTIKDLGNHSKRHIKTFSTFFMTRSSLESISQLPFWFLLDIIATLSSSHSECSEAHQGSLAYEPGPPEFICLFSTRKIRASAPTGLTHYRNQRTDNWSTVTDPPW